MTAGNKVLVYEDNGKLLGIAELKEGRHIASLFVLPGYQGKGIGRQLITAILEQATETTITVSASLTSIGAYEAFGFVCSGAPEEKAGLKFQPMKKQRYPDK